MNKIKFTFQNEVRSCTLVTTNQTPIRLILNQNTKFSDICKLITIVWRQNIQYLKLFLADGTEVLENELINIKKGTTLHAKINSDDTELHSLKYQYDIVKKIGEGGQGSVFQGRNKFTKELVAIKKINSHTWVDQSIEILQQESLILKALDHKNIVKMYESVVFPNQKEILIVMEYLSGGSLLHQANSFLTENDAKVFARQLVDGIAYCHEKNIVHCDLKLENIMLSQNNNKEIKIIDFGVSNYSGERLKTESVVGTLSYLAPEVISPDNKWIQPSQDVWAVGVIIYGLVYGLLPFDGKTPTETVKNIKQCKYQTKSKQISKELQHLFNSIFVLDPKERINIFDIRNHSWFREPIIHKLNITGVNFRIGRSSSVTKMYSQRKSKDEEQILLISQRKIVCSRRSVTRLDKISFQNKIK